LCIRLQTELDALGALALKSITPEDHLVLIEIGGNDLLISVPSDELERALDGLLSN
jgi:hypothetical protein